jgi:hypothetical protein
LNNGSSSNWKLLAYLLIGNLGLVLSMRFLTMWLLD